MGQLEHVSFMRTGLRQWNVRIRRDVFGMRRLPLWALGQRHGRRLVRRCPRRDLALRDHVGVRRADQPGLPQRRLAQLQLRAAQLQCVRLQLQHRVQSMIA